MLNFFKPTSRYHSYFQATLALISGALLTYAFAPYNWYLLAILCPAVLLLTWLNATPTQALWRGFLFGLSFFGTSIYWIFISIHVFGDTSATIAFIITAGFVAVLALCIGVNGIMFRWIFPESNYINLTLGFATSWVIVEWLRGWLFTGFPWMFVGYSQIDSPLAGLAPIVSVYGVSLAVVLSSGLLVNAMQKKTYAIYSIGALVILWLGSFGLQQIDWVKPNSEPITVSLIQGDIPQTVKWDPETVPSTLERYYDLTLPNLNHQIIVWPEAAIPIWLSQATNYTRQLTKELKRTHSVLVTGVPIVDADQTKIYNGAVVLGNGHGTYLKRHLVPFGEYVPLEKYLRGIIGFFDLPMSNLSAGSYHQPLINVAGIPTAVAICYEIAYDAEFMHNFPAAKLIITLSDDAWFGDSWAALQQTQISQMRSLETGRYQLIATNNGLTAIIDPYGRIVKTAPRLTTAVLNGEIYKVTGNTPISRLGIMPIIILLLLSFFAVVLLEKRGNKS